MDPFLTRELALIDLDVPFRAKLSHHHHTWARTFHSRPELFLQPHSIEEIRKIVVLARKCRRRIATTGCGHSPSDLTCTSSWLVNLDRYDQLLDVDYGTGVVVVQAGIRLRDFGVRLAARGLAMPNLGSIDHQSIAGAIATATHGSSIRHGLLSQSVLGLKIMLANGRTASCSATHNQDLFRAALVSLGALGIVIEVTFQAVPAFNIEWQQSLHPLQEILATWDKGLWTESEFTRVWWMPYMKRCIKWRADKTNRNIQPHVVSRWRTSVGYHLYQILLYVGGWFPVLLPAIERLVIRVQYGNTEGAHSTAVEASRNGLLMNCLYSQFVNEWAIPLNRGPEAIRRLSAWLDGDTVTSQIPYSAKGVYVHAPIEVRVTDTSSSTSASPRPYLDNTSSEGPTLYLNATLYRPYGSDPPCRKRYYQAFEYLMRELGGRPHWAKNFGPLSKSQIRNMYPEMDNWLRIRQEIDPEGMFVGDWHRRRLIPSVSPSPRFFSRKEAQDEDTETDEDEYRARPPPPQSALPTLPLEEKQASLSRASDGGIEWVGYLPYATLMSGASASDSTSATPTSTSATAATIPSPHASEDSFDMMHSEIRDQHGHENEKEKEQQQQQHRSVIFDDEDEDDDDDDDEHGVL